MHLPRIRSIRSHRSRRARYIVAALLTAGLVGGAAHSAVALSTATPTHRSHLNLTGSDTADGAAQDAGNLVGPGLTIFTNPDRTGTALGTTTATTTPVCWTTKGGSTAVAVSVSSGYGFVTPSGFTAAPTGLPECGAVAGVLDQGAPAGGSGGCPQYDYSCEQQRADQACDLTAEQWQSLQAEASVRGDQLEQRYQQLLYQALMRQATARAGSALLQQWLSGHRQATPQDIADLIKQSAITPADAAVAALDALHALDDEIGWYAGTACATPGSGTGDGSSGSANSSSGGASNPSGGAGPLGRGSTGRNAPRDLVEELALEQAMADPNAGTVVPLKNGMTDPRWPGADGWVKMSQHINGIEIHYVENTITGEVDDFKIIN